MKINSANKCFYALKTIFKSKIVLVKTKLILNKILKFSFVQYACEIRATTKMDEKNLAIFERKIPCQIFGPKIENMNGGLTK